MKKFALMLAVFVLVLGSFGVAAAQDTGTDNQQGAQVTVSWDGENLSLSENEFTVGEQVTFAADFQDQDNAGDFAGFHVVVWQLNEEGADDDAVWQFNSLPAVMRTASDNMAFTFDEAGDYALALYTVTDADAEMEYTADDATDIAPFTVVEATAATQAQSAEATPTAQAGQDTQSQAQATTQGDESPQNLPTTGAALAQEDDQAPQNLPTTGGESNPWLAIMMVLGVMLLVGGGALLVKRPNR